MSSNILADALYVFFMVLAGPILLLISCFIFKLIWDTVEMAGQAIREKIQDKEWDEKILERQRRVNTYYEAERKKQNRWKIQRPALALSKEFDKLIRS